MSKIIIIGGGVSGLSAGIFARLNGFETVIFEHNHVAGGNLTGWKRNGYTIDNCIHWLTGTNEKTKTYKDWQTVGALGNSPIIQLESLYTYSDGSESLTLYRDIDKLKNEMLTLSPNDEKEINRFIKAIKLISQIQETKNIGNIFYLIKNSPTLLRYARLSTKELSYRFSHPIIRDFLLSLMGKDFTALAIIITFSTFTSGNGDILQGGSLTTAKNVTDKYLSLGGELHLNKDVVKIHKIKNKVTSVTLSDGTTVYGDYVISCVDLKQTYLNLLRENMPSRINRVYSNSKFKRFSSYHCAFSCDLSSIKFKGDYIFKLKSEYKNALNTEYLILREFSHDKSFAPEGKTVIQTITFCSEESSLQFIELKNDIKTYNAKKSYLASIIKKAIEEHFKGLKLTLLDVWTPATYKRFTKAETGSYMSFILPKNTLPKIASSKAQGYKNLYFASQWQKLPGGLPTALELGKKAVLEIVRKEKFKLPKIELFKFAKKT